MDRNVDLKKILKRIKGEKNPLINTKPNATTIELPKKPKPPEQKPMYNDPNTERLIVSLELQITRLTVELEQTKKELNNWISIFKDREEHMSKSVYSLAKTIENMPMDEPAIK